MIVISLNFILEVTCKLVFSIVLKELFTAVTDGNYRLAYSYAIMCGPLWFIGQVGRHNGYYEVTILTSRIKNTLLLLTLKKLSSLSQYTSRTQELGKILNLLSSDFATLEPNALLFFAAMSSPPGILAVVGILVGRFGWPGVIIGVGIAVVFPLQMVIGKFNSSVVQTANEYKDARVKASTEFV